MLSLFPAIMKYDIAQNDSTVYEKIKSLIDVILYVLLARRIPKRIYIKLQLRRRNTATQFKIGDFLNLKFFYL